jgi:hypothetical protein
MAGKCPHAAGWCPHSSSNCISDAMSIYCLILRQATTNMLASMSLLKHYDLAELPEHTQRQVRHLAKEMNIKIPE